MEELIEQLTDKSESVPVPLEPATDEQVLEAEESIFLPLPAEYRVFLKTGAHLSVGRLEPCQVSDPASHTYLAEVTAQAWDVGLDRQFFPICEDSGAYYCMTPEGNVKYWDMGDYAETTWESIWEWVEDVWLER